MIIFVCTGNTCRSPMAEGFYKAATGKEAQSFGLMCPEGVPASKNAVSAMEKFGIDIKDCTSHRITAEAAAAADEILCMTEEQKIMLTYAYPEYSEKIRLLSEAAGKKGNVADPFGGGEKTYLVSAKEIKELVDGYIKLHG